MAKNKCVKCKKPSGKYIMCEECENEYTVFKKVVVENEE